MKYIDRLNSIIEKIDSNFIDFSAVRIHPTAPTQVSSEFLTNKEQGDWAEMTLLNVINSQSNNYIAVKYGRDDSIIAGEDGFKDFYESYQQELDSIGKRPDILIFDKSDFPYDELNISNFSLELLDEIVPKAKCGIEVRSSAFLIDKYEKYMSEKTNDAIQQVFRIKNEIIQNYGPLLMKKDMHLFKLILELELENIHICSFRCPSWKTTSELQTLSNLLKKLKEALTSITKRTYLSITPKVEDIKVVYNWIKKYNVPHYYVQVFFDKAFGISFEKILNLVSQPTLEGKEYYIEGDIKNQNKLTIKINAHNEANVLTRIEIPSHHSEMRELNRGRLLYYVKFDNSVCYINKDEFEKLLGFRF